LEGRGRGHFPLIFWQYKKNNEISHVKIVCSPRPLKTLVNIHEKESHP